MARLTLQLSLGLISLLFDFTTAALLFFLTASTSDVIHQRQFALLLASAVVQTVESLLLGLLLFRCYVSSGRSRALSTASRRRGCWPSVICLGVFPWLVAAATVAIAMGILAGDQTSKFFAKRTTATTLVVWLFSFFVQAFLLLITGSSNHFEAAHHSKYLNGEDRVHSMQQGSGQDTPIMQLSNPFYDKLPSPPCLSPLDGNSSLRSSFSTIRRPPSSKRNFSIRSNSQPRQSDQSSPDGPSSRLSQDEGFASWDTSDLSVQMKETVLQPKTLVKYQHLPTIPGSRSPSPAKLLEGPFFDPSPEHSPPRSPLPQPPVSQPASPTSPEAASFTARFPPATVTLFSTPPSSSPQTQSRRFSRPPSLARKKSGEEHIHPLFRCSSPTPPPSASPTTNVTAAPEAGEVIDRRILNRMRSTSQRSSSQPPASCPLRRSESFAYRRSSNAPLAPFSVEPSPPDAPRNMHQRKRSASFEGCIIRTGV